MSKVHNQSNVYGFDFLKTEHSLSPPTPTPLPPPPTTHPTTTTPPPPPHSQWSTATTDLEKQFDVIRFLQTHRSSGCLPPTIIHKSLGIDLSTDGADFQVAQMLIRNSKIRVEEIPDPENPSIKMMTFGYQAKFNNIRDKTNLLAQINRCKNGVSLRDLSDAYIGVEHDLAALICAGDVLAVANPEDKDKTLFPRGEPFLVELDGNLFLPDGEEEEGDGERRHHDNSSSAEEKKDNNSTTPKRPLTDDEIVAAALKRSRMESLLRNTTTKSNESYTIVGTDIDPRKQLRRGEAVWIGGQWFRVSSAVREGIPLKEQPARAQAPPSVVLMKNLSKKNDAEGYVKPFTKDRLPVDAPITTGTLTNLRNAKTAREKLSTAIAKLKSVHGKTPNASSTPSNLIFSQTGIGAHHANPTSRKRPGAKHPLGDSADVAQKTKDAKDAAIDPSLAFSHSRRHGTTKDVREMYFATRGDVPIEEHELFQQLIKTGLLEEGEAMRRPRMSKKANVDNDGKPKKRRYYERKNQRITNTHLQGTEIGAALARAAEKQAQGKSVGDGGM